MEKVNDWLVRFSAQILQAVVVTLLTWVGYTLIQVQKDVAVLQAEVESVQTTLKQGTDDRYRGSDARRDFEHVYGVLERYDRRLLKMEEHMLELHGRKED